MASVIHPVFGFWFTVTDPCIAVMGLVFNLFFPDKYLLSLTPSVSALSPPHPEATILIIAMAGVLASELLLHLFVLRPRPTDVSLWKTVQAGQIIVEGSKLAAVCWIIKGGGGVSGQVYTNIIISSVLIAGRIAFMLGLGISKVKAK
ncbi:hypothetical protein BX600DRAFT_514200 [Xylariales sp. PMI_506]|nr:hypothetical protein BX600DRAFT_514200 [Xylariales sp. PMI_506]